MKELKNYEMQTINSLEVAEMVGKEHHKLLRDIRRYCVQMNKANEEIIGQSKNGLSGECKIEPSSKLYLEVSDFFIESTYQNSQNKTQPCYLVTKKGCEFIAHKMTGVKGTAFTARYINRFHDMEEAIKQAQQNEQPKITQKTSNTAIPAAPEWRMKNSSKIERLMRNMKLDRKGVYHEILLRVGDYYDLEAAKEIYKQERGFEPPYSMSIIEYFTDLQEYADKVIESLLFMNPDPKPFGWDW